MCGLCYLRFVGILLLVVVIACVRLRWFVVCGFWLLRHFGFWGCFVYCGLAAWFGCVVFASCLVLSVGMAVVWAW